MVMNSSFKKTTSEKNGSGKIRNVKMNVWLQKKGRDMEYCTVNISQVMIIYKKKYFTIIMNDYYYFYIYNSKVCSTILLPSWTGNEL